MKFIKFAVFSSIMLFLSTCEQAPPIPLAYITHIQPDSATSKEIVTIYGAYLEYANEVMVGEISIPFTKDISNNQLLINIPEGFEKGTHSLYLKTQESNSNALKLKILPPKPIIEKISPARANIGDTITIEGASFGENPKVFIESNSVKIFGTTDNEIHAIIPENATSGNLRVENENGSSNLVYFNIVLNDALAPIIDQVTPGSGSVGDIIKVLGRNFNQKLEVYFNSIKINSNNITIKDDYNLEITIQNNVESGSIIIKNEFGSDSFNEFKLLKNPVLIKMLPVSNPRYGPLLLYTDDVKNVQYVQFGDKKIPISDLITSESQNIIAMNVPDLPSNKDYSLKLVTSDNRYSNSISFKILSDSEQGGFNYFSQVTIPNPPQGASLVNVNNKWLITNYCERLFLSLDNVYNGIGVIVDNNFQPVGIINETDLSITLRINNTEYHGTFDNSYQSFGNSRMILTPKQSGSQLELIFPGIFITKVFPEKIKVNQKFSIVGKAMSCAKFVIFQNDENYIWLESPFIVKNDTLQLSINDDNFARGKYKVSIEDDEGFSNELFIELID